jgi:peptide/nickel transport system ATP-binding protein
LLRSIPSLQTETRAVLPVIAGTLPHPFNRPSGCPFHPRCEDLMGERCATAVPGRHLVGRQRAVSCFLHSDVAEPA